MRIFTKLRGLMLFVALLFASGLAMAGDLNGNWSGEADAIYPNGDILSGLLFDGAIYQQENSGLFYGTFTYTIPDVGEISGELTGHLESSGDFSALLSVALGPGGPQAVAVLEGKLTGNKIVATIRDFSDGTTSRLEARRQR
ncbi:MAG: hypothetical protein PVI87_10570 [Gammaproteobacteria bacterium]|jgi:hypothetical protein